MSRIIAINGIRLDKLPLPLESYSDKTPPSQTLPKGEIRYSRRDGTLRLILPPYLSVELYRAGILPQDVNTSVEISIGGRPVGRYLVSDVRYPWWSYSPFGGVTFTLTCVLEGEPIPTVLSELSRPAPIETTTYVTDITHYLDEASELAQLPRPARRLASFLTLLIEEATGVLQPPSTTPGFAVWPRIAKARSEPLCHRAMSRYCGVAWLAGTMGS